ncbi:hypothetical protein [Geodermatophilus sp. Leaf369]|uniref:hypothetical protein n=1 Tax=Geodermatophilus sp. Leaf369 TaxID=1736354 RepID=UPI00191021C0|nr:hypothetical protein [Geodermatophilus sp. Leaf369]
MGFASGLIVIGCFLLGGAWSIFRADDPEKGRTPAQWFFVGVLLLAAALAITSGVLRY